MSVFGSIFDRKPGEDICDCCGTDLSHAPTSRAAIDKERIEELEVEVEQLEVEVERLKAGWKRDADDTFALRAEVERLTHVNLKQSCHMAEKVEAFTARITGLEGALEKIVDKYGKYDGTFGLAIESARAALSQEKT